jgi:MYXO-CTERM domain-containing protein
MGAGRRLGSSFFPNQTEDAMTAFSNKLLIKAASVAVGAMALGIPGEASACGGFFCSSSPVDQTAEHILFTVNPDSVTAIVQISYQGDRDNFAWIVPVPGRPELDTTFPELAFRALDMATQPQYTRQTCFRGGFGFGGIPTAAPSADAGGNGGVTVVAREVVGPYDTVTLSGTSADVLVEWLQNNGYRITEKMVPVIAPYVADGMLFVALRLTPQSNVTDIKPLSMTYPGSQPMIPIKLTAVAAQPEMGLIAYVVSNMKYAPDNYVNLEVPDKLIEFNQFGFQTNYLSLVSMLSDKVGGQAFVTEYAKPTSTLVQQIEASNLPPPEIQPEAAPAREALLRVLGGGSFTTRMYARMSAEEMLDDPRFRVASDQAEVDNIHDLTDPNFDPNTCVGEPPPPTNPCDFNYCGRRGVCAPTVDSVVAMAMGTAVQPVPSCVCADDATARATMTGPNGQPQVYCEPVAMNFDSATAGTGAGPLFVAACEGFDCGPHGTCVPMNGNPTCQCEAGFGATVQQAYDQATGAFKTTLSCAQATDIPPLPVLPPPGQTTVKARAAESSDSGFCSLGSRGRSGGSSQTPVWLLAGLGAAAAIRRRRA